MKPEERSIAAAKRAARAMARERGASYQNCLDEVARAAGRRHWADFAASPPPPGEDDAGSGAAPIGIAPPPSTQALADALRVAIAGDDGTTMLDGVVGALTGSPDALVSFVPENRHWFASLRTDGDDVDLGEVDAECMIHAIAMAKDHGRMDQMEVRRLQHGHWGEDDARVHVVTRPTGRRQPESLHLSLSPIGEGRLAARPRSGHPALFDAVDEYGLARVGPVIEAMERGCGLLVVGASHGACADLLSRVLLATSTGSDVAILDFASHFASAPSGRPNWTVENPPPDLQWEERGTFVLDAFRSFVRRERRTVAIGAFHRSNIVLAALLHAGVADGDASGQILAPVLCSPDEDPFRAAFDAATVGWTDEDLSERRSSWIARMRRSLCVIRIERPEDGGRAAITGYSVPG